ncbi:MAG: ECF transporter S component [Nitrososphaeria archaeon]
MRVKLLALVSVMTPLVTVMTMIFKIPIPATQGYFNFGDAGVMLLSMLFGPYVGLIAGGLGSSLADILSGYSFYAPVTFFAKGVEGFIVGVIFAKFYKKSKLLAYTSGPVGGLFMISSYFIFESYFFSIGNALVELPWNILQALFGSMIAYSLYKLLFPILHQRLLLRFLT